jgi:hypothetical protein
VLAHLGDRSVLADRKGTTASHVSSLLRKAISLSHGTQLIEPAGEEASAVNRDRGGDLMPTVSALLGDVETAMVREEPDLATVVRDEDVPEGSV